MNPFWLILIAPACFLTGSWCRGLKAVAEIELRNKDIKNMMRIIADNSNEKSIQNSN